MIFKGLFSNDDSLSLSSDSYNNDSLIKEERQEMLCSIRNVVACSCLLIQESVKINGVETYAFNSQRSQCVSHGHL